MNIVENKIIKCSKDGVGVKNMNISRITMEKNIIAENGGNGLFMSHVLDTKNFYQVRLIGNKIRDNRLYGVTGMDVGVFSEGDEIMWNGKGGVLLSG
jgi:hypothetical protein